MQLLDHGARTPTEYRINVRVLGDPRVSGRRFDEKTRIEVPRLLFLSSRIYLSQFSDYQVVGQSNCDILTYQSVQQDRNKIYAVALLAHGTEARVTCAEPTTKVRFEWAVNAKADAEKEAA